MEKNRKENASACGSVLCVLCVRVSRLTFVLTFDVKRSFRVCVCVCAQGIHLLLMAKMDQIAVPSQVTDGCSACGKCLLFQGDAMKDSLFSVTFGS